jgi:hypothetical protein
LEAGFTEFVDLADVVHVDFDGLGQEEEVVVVQIVRDLVVAENGEPDFVVGVVEGLLLEGEEDAFEGQFEPRGVFVVHLVHGVAAVDHHHDDLLRH